jgi:2-oxoglutarate dehydrogenase E2 component (dihydrolipoamide succinyltransferase)
MENRPHARGAFSPDAPAGAPPPRLKTARRAFRDGDAPGAAPAAPGPAAPAPAAAAPVPAGLAAAMPFAALGLFGLAAAMAVLIGRAAGTGRGRRDD